MTWQESLLDDPSGFERAVEATSASRWPLPWELVQALHSPDLIAEDKLPILAWALSVDLWDPAWSVEKKRSVVRQSINDHRLKGTLAGVARYLDIEDSVLVQTITPPQRTYASRGLTKAEYDAWLDQMPQLRVYLRSRPGDGVGVGFIGSAFLDDDFAQLDRAALIFGRFPVLVRDGVATPLKVAEVTRRYESRTAIDTERFSVPGVGGESFLDADFVGHTMLDHELVAAQLYTVELNRDYVHETSELAVNTVSPGLEPVSLRFRRMSERGNGGPAAFVSDFLSPAYFLQPDDAEFMLYDVVHLLDPQKAAPMVDALSFIGHTRLGIQPFTAEFMVDAKTFGAKASVFEGEFLGSVFAIPEDLRKIGRAMDAIATSKGWRDKALVTFETTRPRTWGDGLPLNGTVPLSSRLPASL